MIRACLPGTSAGVLALLAGLALPATAQDCRMGVSASDTVLMPGETAQVHAWAHVPNDAYAFAAADFGMSADIPQWTFASDGVIAGANVFNIHAGQVHDPFNGIYADPSNPIRVWTGTFEPASYDPLLVEVRATPTSFWYYPSEFTASSVECPALPGREWIYINPKPFAAGWVAPGEGTTVEIGGLGRDVLIAGAGGDRILIGLLLPAVQAIEMGPWTTAEELTIGVGIGREDRSKIEFELKFEPADAGGYDVRIGFQPGLIFTFVVMHEGEEVASFSCDDGVAPFVIDRLPDAHTTRVNTVRQARPVPGKDAAQPAIVSQTEYRKPVGVLLPDGRRVLADRVEYQVRTNNLKQMGLALHTYHDVRGQEEVMFRVGE